MHLIFQGRAHRRQAPIARQLFANVFDLAIGFAIADHDWFQEECVGCCEEDDQKKHSYQSTDPGRRKHGSLAWCRGHEGRNIEPFIAHPRIGGDR